MPLYGAVHPFDLAVGPRAPWLGEAVFNVEVGAGQFKGVAAEGQLLCSHLLDVLRRPAITSRIGEVRTIVSEHRVDSIWHGCGEVPQKVACDATRCLLMKFYERELGLSVDCYEQVELALFGSHLSKIDVEVANGVRLELRSGRLVAIDIRQPADAVALQAAMQRGARQMWDRRLQRVEAIVQRQQCVASERHHHGFLLDRKRRGPRLSRPGPQVGRRWSLLPLGDRLLVDAVALRQCSQALLLCCIARRIANSPRQTGAHVLLRLDESTYRQVDYGGKSLSMGADHPIAWSRCVGNGGSFYSAIGHVPATYTQAQHAILLENAVLWASGHGETICKAGREVPKAR